MTKFDERRRKRAVVILNEFLEALHCWYTRRPQSQRAALARLRELGCKVTLRDDEKAEVATHD